MEVLRKYKPKRRLTSREKNLLLVLAIVIIFWAAFRFIILPQYNKLQVLESEKEEYGNKISEINLLFKREEAIDKELEELQVEKAYLSDNYFFNLKQSLVLELFYDIFSNENFQVQDIIFSEPFEEEIEGIIVNRMNVDIPYKGTYLGVFEILEVVSLYPKKMLVNSLIMDKNNEGLLSGTISLRLYSLDHDIGRYKETFSSLDLIEYSKNNPFKPFKDYIKEDGESALDTSIVEEPYYKVVLGDFENEGFETAIRDENKLLVDLLNRNIVIEYPPSSIGLWVYSNETSPIGLGISLRDENDEIVDIQIYDGIGWSGSKYIEASLPADINLYPLQVENIYLNNNHDYKGIVLDKLVVNYPKNDISGHPYIYHKVEAGDTLESISMKYYNTKNNKGIIMKYNDMKIEGLNSGRILLIPKLDKESK